MSGFNTPSTIPSVHGSQPSHDVSHSLSDLGEVNTSRQSNWCGFKIVGDNIDKNVRPRHETLERRSRSLHYFHSYAILDRVDLTGYTDEVQCSDGSAIDMEFESLIPNIDDSECIVENFAILASRVVCKYIPAFSDMSSRVTQHIKHSRYEEMCTKSKVVSYIIIVVAYTIVMYNTCN